MEAIGFSVTTLIFKRVSVKNAIMNSDAFQKSLDEKNQDQDGVISCPYQYCLSRDWLLRSSCDDASMQQQQQQPMIKQHLIIPIKSYLRVIPKLLSRRNLLSTIFSSCTSRQYGEDWKNLHEIQLSPGQDVVDVLLQISPYLRRSVDTMIANRIFSCIPTKSANLGPPA